MKINGKETAISDSDLKRYYLEDLEWAIKPSADDPGFLIPKRGAEPVVTDPDMVGYEIF